MYQRLRRLRRWSQLVFFLGFTLLFAFAAFPLKSPIPVDLYLRADPLLALSAAISLRKLVFPIIWYAVPVVVLSLLLGRVFCGWICPMGTAIDGLERVSGIGANSGRGLAKNGRWSHLKYYILLAMLVTMLLPAAHRSASETGLTQSVGLSAVYLMDPIALLTRTFTWVALPVVQWLTGMSNEMVTGWGFSEFIAHHELLDRALRPVQIGLSVVTRPAYFRLGLLTFLIFAGMIALGRYEKRFWCRNLCPLGALLGWIGRFSPVRLAVSEKCNRCLKCVRECKLGAITEDPTKYHGPECIQCLSCAAVCPQHAISVVAGYDASAREDTLRLDRRRVLGAMGAGVAAVVLPKVSLGAKRTDATEKVLKLSSLRLIRPPGSLPENGFVTACVRCGECMKVCPTNTLQPAVGEGGLEALGTPVIVPRVGPCTQPCNLCGQVCPTRAIEPFTIEEKKHLYLGRSSVNRSTCIAWAEDKQCLICDEACPYDAISQKVIEGVPRPVVHELICVGCGICEWVCPVEPLGAITVSSMGDKRQLSREQQRQLREQAPPTGQEEADGSPYPGLTAGR